CRGPAAAQQQRGDRGPPTGGLDGLALLPPAAAAVLYVEHRVTAVEFAGGLEHDRDLLGAVQVHWTLLRDLEPTALADRRVTDDVAVVDGDGKDLSQQIDVHVDRAS